MPLKEKNNPFISYTQGKGLKICNTSITCDKQACHQVRKPNKAIDRFMGHNSQKKHQLTCSLF